MKRQYEKLIVWQEAHTLCLAVYQATKDFPSDERFGLVSQMRRSSSSIPTNIAEGNGRRSIKEKTHFIDISTGSLEELHYQCILARDLSYISKMTFNKLDDTLQRVGYLLMQIRRSLIKSSDSSASFASSVSS